MSSNTSANRLELDISLEDWLNVSWFYPEGFEKEKIISTTTSSVVVGQEVVYKFPKVESGLTAAETFFRRWRAACKEIQDNRQLAENAYLGLRFLRWEADSAHWTSEKTSSSLNLDKPPKGVHDVAIVMRRLEANNSLDNILLNTRAVSQTNIAILARTLSRFHLQNSLARPLYNNLSDTQLVNRMYASHKARLDLFIKQSAGFIDSFSQIALGEIQGFLESFLLRNHYLFVERAKSGCLVETHGNLLSNNIFFMETDKKPVIISRLRDRADRTQDLFYDLATLSVDLEVKGFPLVAKYFEESYFERMPVFRQSELLRFYKITIATNLASKLLTEDPNALKYLTIAFRYTLNLKKSFLIVISDMTNDLDRQLANGLAEFSQAKIISTDCLSAFFGSNFLPEEIHLERLLNLAERRLAAKNSAIMLWRLNRADERRRIAEFAEKVNCDLLFVQFTNNNLLNKSIDLSTSFNNSLVPSVHLEAGLSQADLALYVLRALRPAKPVKDFII